jgi:pimeloyl-ACP methyl ester carboxylesterase
MTRNLASPTGGKITDEALVDLQKTMVVERSIQQYNTSASDDAVRHYAFVHGGSQGGWVWEETIAALRAQGGDRIGATLALDAPGCGAKRSRNTDGLTTVDVARELVEDIERAGIDSAVLVGHSQAGQSLPIMARLRPNLFGKLVYVSCSAPLPGQSVGRMMGDSVRGANEAEVGWPVDPTMLSMVGWPVDPTMVSMEGRFAIMFCNDMTEGQKQSFLAKLGHDNWPALTYSETGWHYDELTRVPATYVECLRDEALPPAWQEIFAHRLCTERILRIDAGHQVMNTRPHALAEILLLEARHRYS